MRPRRCVVALLAVGCAVLGAPADAGTRLGPVVRLRTPGDGRCPYESEPDVVVTRAGTWVAYNDLHQCWTPVANELTSALSIQLLPAGGGPPRYLRVEPRGGGFHNGDPALAPDPSGDGVVVASLHFTGDWPVTSTTGVSLYRVSPSLRVTPLPSPALHGAQESADKELIATDTSPRSPWRGRVYAAWDDGATSSVVLRAFDGRRWLDPVRLGVRGHPAVAVGPHGEVAVAWETYRGVAVRTSRDGGATFGPETLVIPGHRPGRHDPACPLQPVVGVRQRATMATRVAYDTAGRLHVVAAVGKQSWNADVVPPPVATGPGEVVHAVSSGGAWRVTTVDAESAATRFHTVLASLPDGGVAVGWLEEASPTTYDAYVAVAAAGRPFGRPVRVSERAAVFVPATEASLTTSCYGIGDYIGLHATPRGAVLAWPTTDGTTAPWDTDVLVREVYLR